MHDRLSNKPGRILITPEDGSAPFYATITRADEPLQEGDALNKANLLKDQTAARYGKGNNAVPDTIFNQIATELDRYSFAQAGGLKMAFGSYVGDGKYSYTDSAGNVEIDNPVVIECGFAPKVLHVMQGTALGWNSNSLMVYPATYYNHGIEASAGRMWLEWGETFVAMRSEFARPEAQFNIEGITYYWLAIGLGNTGLDFDRLDEMTLLGNDEE